MSAGSCKAAVCSNHCLDSIVVDNFRELTNITGILAANDQLTDDQLDDIIELFTQFSVEVRRRKKADREARNELRAILESGF